MGKAWSLARVALSRGPVLGSSECHLPSVGPWLLCLQNRKQTYSPQVKEGINVYKSIYLKLFRRKYQNAGKYFSGLSWYFSCWKTKCSCCLPSPRVLLVQME